MFLQPTINITNFAEFGAMAELGALAGMRRVQITGRANYQGWFGTIDALEQDLKAIFTDGRTGWHFYNFDFVQDDWTRVGGLEFKINIVADVPNTFTNQEHVDYAAKILQDSGFSVTDINLTISGDDKPGAPAPKKTATAKVGTNSSSNSSSNGGFSIDGEINKLIGGSGMTVTTIALIAAIVILAKK